MRCLFLLNNSNYFLGAQKSSKIMVMGPPSLSSLHHLQELQKQQRDHESQHFSPLLIGLICTLITAFLAVSYYTIFVKYCTRWRAFGTRSRRAASQVDTIPDDGPPAFWPVYNNGLERALIESIPVLVFDRNNELPEGATHDCAVCLSEFDQGESLRLLPKCTHAFHLDCIDMWLSSHSNCPICRADIVIVKPEDCLSLQNNDQDTTIPSFAETVISVNLDPNEEDSSHHIEQPAHTVASNSRRSFSLDSSEGFYIDQRARSVVVTSIKDGSAEMKDFSKGVPDEAGESNTNSTSPSDGHDEEAGIEGQMPHPPDSGRKIPGRPYSSGPLDWIRSSSTGGKSIFRAMNSRGRTSSMLPL